MLGAADPCDKLAFADQIVAELGGGQDAIDAAIGLVTAEQNFNNFNQDTPDICTDATLPATEELRGRTPLIDPNVDGAAAANALSAQTKVTALDAAGKSIADLLTENGFTAFNGAAAGAGAAAGDAAAGNAAAGNAAAGNAAAGNAAAGNAAAGNAAAGNAAAGNANAVNNNNQQASDDAADDCNDQAAAAGNANANGNAQANGNGNAQANGNGNAQANGNGNANANGNGNANANGNGNANANGNGNGNENGNANANANANGYGNGNANGNGNGNANQNANGNGNANNAAAGGAAAGGGANDFGTCDPTMSFEGGRANRDADEFTFQSNDAVIAANQQEALNPNIITNRICDELGNICGASDAAIAVCEDAQAQIEALGTRDQTTADAWNQLVGGGAARAMRRGARM